MKCLVLCSLLSIDMTDEQTSEDQSVIVSPRSSHSKSLFIDKHSILQLISNKFTLDKYMFILHSLIL